MFIGYGYLLGTWWAVPVELLSACVGQVLYFYIFLSLTSETKQFQMAVYQYFLKFDQHAKFLFAIILVFHSS